MIRSRRTQSRLIKNDAHLRKRERKSAPTRFRTRSSRVTRRMWKLIGIGRSLKRKKIAKNWLR